MSRVVAACLSLLLVAVSGGAQATEARSQSLLYNLAFEDQTDVFVFPNLLPEYEGLYFHLPQVVQNVYGGVIFNFSDKSAIGAFVHRPLIGAFDQYRLSATDVNSYLGYSPFDSGNALQPQLSGQVFDLMYGARTWGLALRVHGWSNASTQDPPLADPAEAAAALSIELNSGFRLTRGLNLRVGLGVRNVWDNYLLLLGRVGMRYMDPGKRRIRAVVAAQLEFGMLMPDGGGDDSFALTVPIKGGVRIAAIEDVLFVGLLAGIDAQVLALDGDDTRFGLVIPILELGAEWNALEWLRVRTAIKGGYGFQLAGTPGDNNPKHEQMTFSSGLGIPLGPFVIDAVIQYSLWQDGPWFVGGNPGLFAGVSLAYQWGRGAEGQSTASPPPPEPTTAAAPPVQPAEQDKTQAASEKQDPAAKDDNKQAGEGEKKSKPEFEGWD